MFFFFTSDKSSIELERETAFQASIIPESISKQGEKAIILHASTFFLATYPMTTCSGNRSSQPLRVHPLLCAVAHRWLSPHKSRVCERKGCKDETMNMKKKEEREKAEMRGKEPKQHMITTTREYECCWHAVTSVEGKASMSHFLQKRS